VGKDRRSLFDVLVKNIKNGKITEVYADDYFNTKKTFKEMSSSFTFIDTIPEGKTISMTTMMSFILKRKSITKK